MARSIETRSPRIRDPIHDGVATGTIAEQLVISYCARFEMTHPSTLTRRSTALFEIPILFVACNPWREYLEHCFGLDEALAAATRRAHAGNRTDVDARTRDPAVNKPDGCDAARQDRQRCGLRNSENLDFSYEAR